MCPFRSSRKQQTIWEEHRFVANHTICCVCYDKISAARPSITNKVQCCMCRTEVTSTNKDRNTLAWLDETTNLKQKHDSLEIQHRATLLTVQRIQQENAGLKAQNEAHMRTQQQQQVYVHVYQFLFFSSSRLCLPMCMYGGRFVPVVCIRVSPLTDHHPQPPRRIQGLLRQTPGSDPIECGQVNDHLSTQVRHP